MLETGPHAGLLPRTVTMLGSHAPGCDWWSRHYDDIYGEVKECLLLTLGCDNTYPHQYTGISNSVLLAVRMRSARASLFWKVWFATNAFACSLAVAMDTTAQQGLPPFSSSSSVLLLQRIPGHTPATAASVQGMVCDETGRGVAGVSITATRAGVAIRNVTSNSEGIFRMLDLPLGAYQFDAGKDGFSPEALSAVQLTGGEL